MALSRVFRAKCFEAMRFVGLHCQETMPDGWVVHCKKVGRGEQALLYLGRYLYRRVLPEKNIIAERDVNVSFCFQDNKGKRKIHTLPGDEFLWLLFKHVLPRRFRRVRDFGLLHANAKGLIQLLQLTLQMRVPRPNPLPPRPHVLCEHSGEKMAIIARMIELTTTGFAISPLC